VAYDIADRRRLSRVAKVLLDYGTRIQKSVFLLQISDRQLKRMRERIEEAIDPVEDGVKYFPLCNKWDEVDKGVVMKLMVVSVGGSPGPIVFSLNEQQPDYIVYFASKESRKLIATQIEPRLSFRPKDVEKLVTPDEQNLLQCVQYLLREIPRCLELWEVAENHPRILHNKDCKFAFARRWSGK